MDLTKILEAHRHDEGDLPTYAELVQLNDELLHLRARVKELEEGAVIADRYHFVLPPSRHPPPLMCPPH